MTMCSRSVLFNTPSGLVTILSPVVYIEDNKLRSVLRSEFEAWILTGAKFAFVSFVIAFISQRML
jgi:hypothetical protein